MAGKKKKEEGVIRTPKFFVQYAHVFAAEKFVNEKTGEETFKFGVTALFDVANFDAADKAAWKVMQAAAKKLGIAKLGDQYGKSSKILVPFLDGNEETWDGFKDRIYCRMSTFYKPDVINLADEKLETPEQFYNGCVAIGTCKPYAFDNKSKGVKFGLRNLLFIKDGEPLGQGTTASEDFSDMVEAAPDGNPLDDDIL